MPYPHVPFYTLTAIALAVFAWGFGSRVAFWLKVRGSAYAPPFSAPQATPAHAISLATFLADALLQRQILRQSRLRWAMHMSIMWGFIELFFVGSLGNFFMERGWVSISKDTPWFAALNESAGLLLMLGVSIGFYRRYFLKPAHLRSQGEDLVVLTLLGVLGVTGFLLEAGRFLAITEAAPNAPYSYVGHLLYLAAHRMNAGWLGVYRVLWWLHAVMGLGLVAYIPYSKLLHMFSSPLLIATQRPVQTRLTSAAKVPATAEG
ncbi:MAG: respiratory nitrate reductase subunit gamma [Chloroflexi bacterium]|nr:respiratory nitrate reductase subunit gamma [Chloroflexota bacterium]